MFAIVGCRSLIKTLTDTLIAQFFSIHFYSVVYLFSPYTIHILPFFLSFSLQYQSFFWDWFIYQSIGMTKLFKLEMKQEKSKIINFLIACLFSVFLSTFFCIYSQFYFIFFLFCGWWIFWGNVRDFLRADCVDLIKFWFFLWIFTSRKHENNVILKFKGCETTLKNCKCIYLRLILTI
jgi:hypothetical protein